MGVLSGIVKSLTGRANTIGELNERHEASAELLGRNAATSSGEDVGRLPSSIKRARERIDANPGDGDAWNAWAATLMNWGRRREALAVYRQAWERGASSMAVALGLGVTAWESGHRDEAERVLRQGLAVHPDSPDLNLALARMLDSAGRATEAREIVNRVLARDPSNTVALLAVARCDRAEGHADRAENALRRALAIDDSDPHLWERLSSALASQGRHDAALQVLDDANAHFEHRGSDFEFAFARAELLRLRSDFREMTALLATTLRERPNTAGQFMLAEALIVQGHFRAGWRQFEFRKLEPAMVEGRQHYGKPAWTGQDLAGRTILVEAEQGIGDVIWFARYFPLLKDAGARVVFLPRIDMENVSRRLPGIDNVLHDGEVLPAFDFHVKLMSLATCLGTTLATVPGGIPYLAPDPAFAARWQAQLAADGRPRIGLVWAGKPAQPRDRFRSMHASQLLPVLRVPDLRFFSLQKGLAEAQLAELPADVAPTHLGDQFDDPEDLVAAMSHMDLIISVCTGPAHIAGAMGKPVWTLISDPPDMRWLTEREDSPWYPTMRLFRQRAPGQWNEVIERVARELGRGAAAWEALISTPGADASRRAGVPVRNVLDEDGLDAGLAQLAESRQGLLMYDPRESLVGRSIEHCGEWLQPQLELALQLLRQGGVAIEAGAGIGAHAIALARALGADGQAFLYERRPAIRRMLQQNLSANAIANVTLMTRELSGPSPEGFTAERETVDHLQLDRLDGIKVNTAGDAAAILEGAQETLWRCRPWMMLAAPDDAALTRLGVRVREFGYRTWRMETPYFSPSNFNRRDDDIFGGGTALALVALPEEADLRNPLTGCVELR